MTPLAQSVAGDLVPNRAGAAVSVVVSVSYGWFLLAGPAVGGLAELVGLRTALGVVTLAGIAIFALSARIEDNQSNPVSNAAPRSSTEAEG